jgi:pyruvate kinase
MRRTKIIATLGPASSDRSTVREIVAAGVDVFRLNFSHGTHDSHKAAIAEVRQAAEEAGRIVGLLQDLGGPKIRTGRLRGGTPILLTTGDRLAIVVGDGEGDPDRIFTSCEDLPAALRPGDTLLLDDGRLELRVEGIHGNEIQSIVVDGGLLGERKGINAPGVALPLSGLTAKDVQDLRFGLAAGVDAVGLSFVRDAALLRQAREQAAQAGRPRVPLVAKLERPEAVARLDEILRAADAVMVARGDLGLEVPLERVPRIQKEVTRSARALDVPVIVATQVLESMRTEPRPTRAEVSDAANAVDDGVDAIMLAGETAAGAHPVRTVQTLDLVIREAESIPPADGSPIAYAGADRGHGHAICEAAVTLAERSRAQAIVAVTRGGATARILSARRPRAPIFAATADAAVARQLTLYWGVAPVLTDLAGDVAAFAARIGGNLVSRGALEAGAAVVLVSVARDLSRGPSNFVKLQRV